jgi:hypothetical protein
MRYSIQDTMYALEALETDIDAIEDSTLADDASALNDSYADDSAVLDAGRALSSEGFHIAKQFSQLTSVLEDIDVLKDMNEVVQDSIDAGESLSPEAANLLQIGVESIYQRLGIVQSSPVCSLESFKADETKLLSTKLALEDGNNVIKTVLEFFKNLAIKIYDGFIAWVKKVINALLGLKGKVREAAKYFVDMELGTGLVEGFACPEMAGYVVPSHRDFFSFSDISQTIYNSVGLANNFFLLCQFCFKQISEIETLITSSMGANTLKIDKDKFNHALTDSIDKHVGRLKYRFLLKDMKLAGCRIIDTLKLDDAGKLIYLERRSVSNIKMIMFKMKGEDHLGLANFVAGVNGKMAPTGGHTNHSFTGDEITDTIETLGDIEKQSIATSRSLVKTIEECIKTKKEGVRFLGGGNATASNVEPDMVETDTTQYEAARDLVIARTEMITKLVSVGVALLNDSYAVFILYARTYRIMKRYVADFNAKDDTFKLILLLSSDIDKITDSNLYDADGEVINTNTSIENKNNLNYDTMVLVQDYCQYWFVASEIDLIKSIPYKEGEKCLYRIDLNLKELKKPTFKNAKEIRNFLQKYEGNPFVVEKVDPATHKGFYRL